MKNSNDRSYSKNKNSNKNNNNYLNNKKKHSSNGFDTKIRSIPKIEKLTKTTGKELVSPKTIDYSKSSNLF